MDLGIKGKVAIVTGASQGIGKATALALAAEGVNVCVCDVKEEAGRQTVSEIEALGVKSFFQKTNVAIESEVKELFAKTKENLGPVNILVNNAAISPKHPFYEISGDEFKQVMEVNLLGTFLCSREAFEHMKEDKWGRIINMSSMAGKFGANNAGAHYASTKAGIVGLTLSLAKKMGPYNITVNATVPGRIMTELTRVLPQEKIDAITQQIPLGYIGSPEEVANVITFLASQKASYVTGASVDLLGGYIA
ncbi:MAG TPA: SDR family oxidoreductase [Clostridiaceae bacterium]|nr:SDR family oxidoreductase [Clostridiaceae bacterium]